MAAQRNVYGPRQAGLTIAQFMGPLSTRHCQESLFWQHVHTKHMRGQCMPAHWQYLSPRRVAGCHIRRLSKRVTLAGFMLRK